MTEQICKCGHLIDYHIEQINGMVIAGECGKCDCLKYGEDSEDG